MSFPDWYGDYPKKIGRQDAEKAYNAALKQGHTHSAMMAGLRGFNAQISREKTDPKFIPYPASWIRAGRWLDETLPGSPLPLFEAIQRPQDQQAQWAKLESLVGDASAFHVWFKDAKLEGNRLIIPSPFKAKLISQKYYTKLRLAFGPDVEVG